MPERPTLVIRWATWWPIHYWIDRFNALAQWPGIEFEAIFLAPSQSHYPIDLDASDWRFKHRILSRGTSSAGFYKISRKLLDPRPLIPEGRGTALVMPYADPAFMSAAALAWLKRRPYHLFVANTKYDSRSGSQIYEAAKVVMFRGARGCLATGPLQVEYARAYAGPSKPLYVIGNPVDGVRLRQHAQEFVRSRDEERGKLGWEAQVVVCYVGRLAPEKDLSTLITAISQTQAQDVSMTLVLVGTGPEESKLRMQSAALGVRTHFAGFLEGEQLARVYASSDIFVLPSTSEPWGLVVNEAMEFGLPSIVSDRVGAKHLVTHGENGFHFHAGDAQELSKLLLRLAQDPSLRKVFGNNSRIRIRDETIANWCRRVITALRASDGTGARENYKEAAVGTASGSDSLG